MAAAQQRGAWSLPPPSLANATAGMSRRQRDRDAMHGRAPRPTHASPRQQRLPIGEATPGTRHHASGAAATRRRNGSWAHVADRRRGSTPPAGERQARPRRRHERRRRQKANVVTRQVIFSSVVKIECRPHGAEENAFALLRSSRPLPPRYQRAACQTPFAGWKVFLPFRPSALVAQFPTERRRRERRCQ